MLLETALADFSVEREWSGTSSTSTDSPGETTPVGSPGGESRESSSSGGSSFNERKRPVRVGGSPPDGGQSGKRSSSRLLNEQRIVDSPPGQSVKRRSFIDGRRHVVDSPDVYSYSSSFNERTTVDSPDQSSKYSSFNERKPVDSPEKFSNSSSFNEGMPVALSPGQSSTSSSFISERRHNVHRLRGSQEEEELHLQEDEVDRKETQRRSQLGQFYGKQGSVPFEWEASPGKPMVQESLTSSTSNHPGTLRPPPGLRALVNSSGSAAARNTQSPPTGVGITEKMKSILGGKGPRNGNASTTSAQGAAPDSSANGREDGDRDSSSGHSDDSFSSPVSTLDLRLSPLSPTFGAPEESGIVERHGGRLGNPRPASHLTSSTFIGLSEMSEELPSVMEEDEEDLESASGFHTIEFQTMESPCAIEDRGDWSSSSRAVSSKSLSAPNSRQSSSLRPGLANRGRRRSDFDWPEDFDERPEEVVKEVDDSLWAFSPVASTFVFSGNDASPSLRPGVTRTSTPGSSPFSGSGLEPLSSKRSLVRSAFSLKPSHGLRSSTTEAAAAAPPYSEFLGRRKSSRFRHGRVKGDDDDLSYTGTPTTKKSFSCLPFFSLCGSQRPTPTISFSQRLSPTVKS